MNLIVGGRRHLHSGVCDSSSHYSPPSRSWSSYRLHTALQDCCSAQPPEGAPRGQHRLSWVQRPHGGCRKEPACAPQHILDWTHCQRSQTTCAAHWGFSAHHVMHE